MDDNGPDKLNSRLLRRKRADTWPTRFPEDDGLALRIHRSISWLARAEREQDDPDAQYVFYWIAFNAAYASLLENRETRERDNFSKYFKAIVPLDSDRRIYNAVWNIYSGPIRILLDNKFVFQPFWNYYNGMLGYNNWEERFQREKTRLNDALGSRDTEFILSTLFNRLYVLRNQLIHGGATWNSSVNREQVKDGSRILATLVPIMVDIMMDNPRQDWGPPYYPIVKP